MFPWDITLGHWVCDSYVLKDYSPFIFKHCSPTDTALTPREQIPQPRDCKDLKTSLILFNNTVLFVNSE